MARIVLFTLIISIFVENYAARAKNFLSFPSHNKRKDGHNDDMKHFSLKKLLHAENASAKTIVKTSLLFLCVAFVCVATFMASYVFGLHLTDKLDKEHIYGVAQSTLVYDKDGNVVANIHGVEDRTWVALSEVPECVKQAVISAEDVRFYAHAGLDIKRIFGALWADIKSGSLDQGASTLTQQLIKNSLLTREKAWSRKIEEALLAVEMERRYTKDEILEMYLNYNYFGAGAYGVEAAAQTYFQIHASQLSVDQAALLAGILKSSDNYAPHL